MNNQLNSSPIGIHILRGGVFVVHLLTHSSGRQASSNSWCSFVIVFIRSATQRLASPSTWPMCSNSVCLVTVIVACLSNAEQGYGPMMYMQVIDTAWAPQGLLCTYGSMAVRCRRVEGGCCSIVLVSWRRYIQGMSKPLLLPWVDAALHTACG